MRAFVARPGPIRGCAVAQYRKRSGVSSSGRRRRMCPPPAPTGRSNSDADRRRRTRRIIATRGFRLFDGQVMVQTGLFEGVPVYADTTIEPYSERLRAGGQRSHAPLRTAARTASWPAPPAATSPSFPVRELRSSRRRRAIGSWARRAGRHRTAAIVRAARLTAVRSSESTGRAAPHVDHRRRRCTRPRAAIGRSGWSSTERAGTATAPRCRSHPIASSRSASITVSRCIATKSSGSGDIWIPSSKTVRWRRTESAEARAVGVSSRGPASVSGLSDRAL